MRKDKEIADPNSCLNRAKPDEPIMVLRAHDASAPGLVRSWALQRTAAIHAGTKPASDLAVVDEAIQLADQMEAWRAAEVQEPGR
jgi:hypothetical protein